jgi:hypothetical protein
MIIFISSLFFACTKDQIEDKILKVSDISPSLITEDHVSEGFLITLSNGDHVGNNGRIVRRTSKDNGNTWSVEETIYSDEFDDRNIRGGITEDGAIVLFFRRYDKQIWQAVDLNYIISFDGGNNWSERVTVNFGLDHIYEVWIDNFIKLGPNKYMLPIHGVEYCEIRFFNIIDNSLLISDKIWDWDYTTNHLYGIDEPMFTLIDGNRILGLFRDETERLNYFQVTSTDLGNTWTQPVRTNICKPYFSPSPLVFYDENNNKVIVVGTDRREFNGEIYLAEDSQIWIYSNNPDSIFTAPYDYHLYDTIKRPLPSDYMLYGYSSYTKTKENKYLIVFTDSSFDGENEDANMYQFTIQYQ